MRRILFIMINKINLNYKWRWVKQHMNCRNKKDFERSFRQSQKFYPWSWNCRPNKVQASRKNLANKIKLINQPFLLI